MLICSCENEKEPLELIILNQEVVSCGHSYEILNEYSNLTTYQKKSLNVITYKIVNNSDTPYYFNKLVWDPVVHKDVVESYFNGNEYTSFSDKEGNKAKSGNMFGYPADSLAIYLQFKNNLEEKERKALGYGPRYDENIFSKINFVIHPKETLYFEYPIHLPRDITWTTQSDFIFKKGEKYTMQVQIISDSSNYNTLSRVTRRTIEANSYKIFRGVLTSRNKVPVRFIDCQDR